MERSEELRRDKSGNGSKAGSANACKTVDSPKGYAIGHVCNSRDGSRQACGTDVQGLVQAVGWKGIPLRAQNKTCTVSLAEQLDAACGVDWAC